MVGHFVNKLFFHPQTTVTYLAVMVCYTRKRTSLVIYLIYPSKFYPSSGIILISYRTVVRFLVIPSANLKLHIFQTLHIIIIYNVGVDCFTITC